MGGAVLGGDGPTDGSDGAGGELGVGPVGGELSQGDGGE